MELKKNSLKEFWNFVWNGNSIWSWIVSIILLFIIVKFIFFPVLSLVFATKLPLVVVESSSMHHPGNFIGNIIGTQKSFDLWWDNSKEWYLNHGISKEQAEKWKLKGGLEKGDIVILSGWKQAKQGDIIVFNGNTKHPIIHRVVNINELGNKKIYSTKGDNNFDQLQTEKKIQEDAIVGKAVFVIPKIGWLKLFFVEILKPIGISFSEII